MDRLLDNLWEVDEKFVPGALNVDAQPSEMPESEEKQGVNEEEGKAGSSITRDQRSEKQEGEQGDEHGAGQDPDEDDGKIDSETAASDLSDLEMHDDREHGLILSFV
jgi:hypothetical protein